MEVKKRTMWVLAGICLLFSFFVLLIFGTSYTFGIDVPQADAEAYTVEIDQDEEYVRRKEKTYSDGKLHVTFESVNRGKAFFTVYGPDDFMYSDMIYVHRMHIMTVNSYMGYTRGAMVIPITGLIFLAVLLAFNISEYRKGLAESLYQYKNVRTLSWIIFDVVLLINQAMFLFTKEALVDRVSRAMSSATYLAYITFPVAFLLSILVIISNVRLMMKEGKTWRNMLGVIMSVMIILGTMLPQFISDILNSNPSFVDLHIQRSVWPYVEILVTNLVLILVSYLECILISTIILTVKAAKKVPAFDKDYILILGCQIKLLQGRVDRALEFARMQKEHTARALTFVPSGGQGSDEVIAEAAAIHNYLVEQGIPEERILVEDGSCSTEENMRKSYALILKQNQEEPKIAFATTNYHVFRSGIIANNEGLHAEGIGSPTRTYFWVNAFVREFVATLYSERKTHHRVVRSLSLTVFLSAAFVYIANIL